MATSKLKVLVFITFVVALATGIAAGMVYTRKLPAEQEMKPAMSDRPTLSDELSLTPGQREQMKVIWEKTRLSAADFFDDAQNLQKGRDEAVLAILNNEQKAQFEKISQGFANRFDALTARREALFQNAVEQTRQILSPAQREKYEEVLRRKVGSNAHSPDWPPLGSTTRAAH